MARTAKDASYPASGVSGIPGRNYTDITVRLIRCYHKKDNRVMETTYGFYGAGLVRPVLSN
jgi:hypothetical protein